jgi:hypothetical protein
MRASDWKCRPPAPHHPVAQPSRVQWEQARVEGVVEAETMDANSNITRNDPRSALPGAWTRLALVARSAAGCCAWELAFRPARRAGMTQPELTFRIASCIQRAAAGAGLSDQSDKIVPQPCALPALFRGNGEDGNGGRRVSRLGQRVARRCSRGVRPGAAGSDGCRGIFPEKIRIAYPTGPARPIYRTSETGPAAGLGLRRLITSE